ncbi:MAG: Vi polysaccharide biosynthesis protein VipB/TviC [Bacteroidetes bacterium GWE2_42_24]|nr:MAG: Vi polysaccharide biosynthesis protein VipB/TviC [Bacteroidetes bacterium GWE2_42_24]OFY31177.1 MAG: Vi polysaccharide biosynthesis protein VipB/TviC [Bacteroidetes bacterium GWF2_43_11]HCT86512.1 LPS biosynthesis protein WbpP [Candidatus Margulisiibacteriota bacterium]
MTYNKIKNTRVLVTGGAGFIGSNLCEDLLANHNQVVCLDNFATGHFHNIEHLMTNPGFKLIVGDIRNLSDCHKACEGIDVVFHEAALGSVPRSINDPITTNDVNIGGFLNMLVASRDAGVGRFIYAASSSTYGDSEKLPKIEEVIGMPLSPYAVTKYVNELYAHVFALNYGITTIGLRYFNVYGRRQDPHGAYAAVIPLFVKKLMSHESPVINGDGTNSRDFTYIDNVLQMNHLAAVTDEPAAYNQVFNTAVGERNNLLQLTTLLKQYLTDFDQAIAEVPILHGSNRPGDIPHSHASVDKARNLLGYQPTHTLKDGLKDAVQWYWNNL